MVNVHYIYYAKNLAVIVNVLHYLAYHIIHAGIEITIFHVGMQSVNSSIKPSCSLLWEAIRAWLLQLCLPSLTESGGIDGLRQFRTLTSHTLVEMRGVF